MLALVNAIKLVIENRESASGNKRSDISAGKSKVRVGGKNGIFHHAWFVIVRIDRVHRENHRIVRRKRSGDDFVSSNKGAGKTAIESMDESRRVSLIRTAENRGLLHGAANFSAARKFRDVIDASAELVFRPGATDKNERRACQKNRKKVRSHKMFLG